MPSDEVGTHASELRCVGQKLASALPFAAERTAGTGPCGASDSVALQLVRNSSSRLGKNSESEAIKLPMWPTDAA